ncbi:ABC transporter substrate-binding protein [Paenibacillus oceani]|uniref:Extracellular solute-binding protein n=1 Tax=Paenibacillus oceani TaxID=2772510 RepID=A0A927C9A7_9BACL|nr:extracellular solute-binding protein [Paenibacillus oceani]MBD2862387.1 extracellular solute-binding protein [Paenibacillus oceani]
MKSVKPIPTTSSKTKRAVSCRAAMTALLLVLASGCASAPAETIREAGDASPQDGRNEQAKLVFYSNNGNSEESFNQSFGNALRKKFPNYTIEYIRAATGTSLQDVLASGTKFDIFFTTIGNFERYMIESGMEYDMRELIKKHNVSFSDLDPVYVEYMNGVAGGAIYGFPIQNNVMTLYYNKTLFQKFGVPFPQNGMTWDEAIELGRKLTRQESGTSYVGLTVNPANTANQNQFSLPSVDPSTMTPTINTNPLWKPLFETLFVRPFENEIARTETIRLKKIPDHYTFVRDQTLAMYGYSSGLITALGEEMKQIDWDIAALPAFREKPGVGAQPYPIQMGITSFSENKDAAMTALKFLLSEEYQKEISEKGQMPVLKLESVKQAFGSKSAFSNKNYSALFYNKMASIAFKTPPYGAAIDRFYTNGALQLAQGQTDINTLFRQAEEEATKEINALRQNAK